MELIVYDEARKIWKELNQRDNIPALETELEIHKKLLNIFHVGDYYFFIFNCVESTIEYINETVVSVLGYDPEEFTVPYIVNKIHPDDLPWFLNFEATIVDFFNQLPPEKCLKYKSRYDYRILNADGQYVRILQQSICIQVSDKMGGLVRSLCIHTDITHLKPEGKPTLSFIGLDGEPSYIDVKPKQAFSPQKEILTHREKEILSLLISGKNSKEISEQLYISKHTVNTHRKNILAKAQVGSSSELVAKAIKEGWI